MGLCKFTPLSTQLAIDNDIALSGAMKILHRIYTQCAGGVPGLSIGW